ncbi:hypothetical protein [Pedobacter sp. JCM 36344]|uniref:hypothetical protein n=1 Tax=Pedobacter sp. JCM 36344 TaxID=3374280 RepID=UPI00397C0539
MPDNEGMLTFKNHGQNAHINRLSNSLGFVGKMKHLSHAIDHHGKQECAYELRDWKGFQWVLNCTFRKGIVALDLWMQKYGFKEQLKTIFSWEGNAEEFRESINLMIDKAESYKYFIRG